MARTSQDIVRIECAEWVMEISSTMSAAQYQKAKALDVITAQATYRLAHEALVQSMQLVNHNESTELQFKQGVAHKGFVEYHAAPLFFDNGKATVEITFKQKIDLARIHHLSAAVCDSFVQKGNRLIGVLDFGNDLGQFDLSWEWVCNGLRKRSSFLFTVYSTKLNLEVDFKSMMIDVQAHFQWLRMDLLRQTQWGLASANTSATLQSWVSVFRTLERDLYDSYHRLILRYRQRLQSQEHFARAERIRRMPARLEEEVARWNKERAEKLHRYEIKVLDPDTMENRFVKAALQELIHDMVKVQGTLKDYDEVADSFKDWIQERITDWKSIASHPFWRSIGDFRGWRQESLILARDPVYSRILQGWKLLRKGLRFALMERFAGGMQSVDQLYEVWCLLQFDQQIRSLGWSAESTLWDEENLRWDDLAKEAGRSKGRITYTHALQTNARLHLLYQPSASAKPSASVGWESIAALPVIQNPDLVLRLVQDGIATKTWIFDSKYRVDIDNKNPHKESAPPDAIDQMHRYRDAILWTQDSIMPGEIEHQRESIGAYVLFPGKNESWESHAQHQAIGAVNIGAFQLHPNAAHRSRQLPLLNDFLMQRINISEPVRDGWDESTPLPKGTIPVEAKVFFAPSNPILDSLWQKSQSCFFAPWSELLKVMDRGNVIRNCTHVAIRKADSTTECKASRTILARKKVTGLELIEYLRKQSQSVDFGDLDLNQEYMFFELGPVQTMDIQLLKSMPQYGVMTWNRYTS